jgi:transcriptional regulator with XRE-family HTH domain
MAERDDLKVFGEVLRAFRSERAVSQEHLAAVADLHRTYISLLERGLRNPSLTVIRRLASALGVTATDLVSVFEAKAGKVRT